MVDNRSAGFFGIGGAFNFKSGDISGTAAKMQDDKMGGNEYFGQGEGEEEQKNKDENFVDRSAQLRATLNSLAMLNVASVLNSRKNSDQKKIELLNKENEQDEKNEKREQNRGKEELDEEFLNDFDDDLEGDDEP